MATTTGTDANFKQTFFGPSPCFVVSRMSRIVGRWGCAHSLEPMVKRPFSFVRQKIAVLAKSPFSFVRQRIAIAKSSLPLALQKISDQPNLTLSPLEENLFPFSRMNASATGVFPRGKNQRRIN